MPIEAMLRFLVRRQDEWPAQPQGFASALKQTERRNIIERERERHLIS